MFPVPLLKVSRRGSVCNYFGQALTSFASFPDLPLVKVSKNHGREAQNPQKPKANSSQCETELTPKLLKKQTALPNLLLVSCQVSSQSGKNTCDQAHARINLAGQTTTNKYHRHEKGGVELNWLSAPESCWSKLLQTFDVSDMLAYSLRILVSFSEHYSNTKITFTQQCGHYRD